MRIWRTIFFVLALAPAVTRAQMAVRIPPNVAAQLMVPQPAVDNSQPENISATAEFDPPCVRPGGKAFYRVTITATENSIAWPDKIPAPPELRFGARAHGQLMQPDGTPFHPVSGFVCEITATNAGHFVVSNLVIWVGGRSLEIPAASLDAASQAAASPARKLSLEVSDTNLFIGQPFRVRVILPATSGKRLETLREVQFNGDPVLTDRMATRRSVEAVNHDGQLTPAFIYETVATPLVAGTLNISAQGFTAGGEFGGPMVISVPVTIPSGPPKNVLLVSDAVSLNVRPLPTEAELPGYTGAIGKFFSDPPRLATNRIHLGEPVSLNTTFHGKGDLTRFVPPALPASRDWQIIADDPPDNGFTLIPITDEVQETPAIPFSYFDPATAKYVDLSIPPLPVTVVGERLPEQLPPADDEAGNTEPLKLTGLAATPGKAVATLTPLQLRGWFVGGQLVPVLGFLVLWQWDRRRRFLEAHPEIGRRRQAIRALRREKIKMKIAIESGSSTAFVIHAAEAMRIAVAPMYPANPVALVGGDVLTQLDQAARNGRAGETVKKIFAAADEQFSIGPKTQADLLALAADVETVLQQLEEKL